MSISQRDFDALPDYRRQGKTRDDFSYYGDRIPDAPSGGLFSLIVLVSIITMTVLATKACFGAF